ncbi:MAG: hypothetical protein ACJAS9_000850 [Polaribacter sp.]|jgi:hypothetical protein
MRVFEANENIKNALNAFYVSDGYHSDWSSIVRTFFAIANDEINGSVKVERANFVSVFRGMYISPYLQRSNLDTKLIKHIEPILNVTTSYCMSFSHLNKLYAQIKFNLDSYPVYLCKRYLEYEREGYKIILMMREIAIQQSHKVYSLR